MNNDKNTKSKVAVISCESYDEELVFKSVKSAVEAIGGIGSFVSQSENILVKPNFLYPSEADKAITTHPAVISAVLRLLNENGCQNVLFGDSPANGNSSAAVKKLEISEDKMFGAKPALMTETVVKDFPEGKTVKKFHFAKEVTQAGAIIGVCKMKTHMLERITGAVKNMYGLICGAHKAAGHVSWSTAVSFAKMLADIHNATPQRLHIMDGITAMEGNGPSSGSPVHMGVILASADPVALDSVFCKMINLQPELVPTNTQGQLAGIGTYEYDKIEILLVNNDTVTEISPEKLFELFGKADFDVQREKDKFSILSLWNKLTGGKRKPVIDSEKCIKCGICVNHCPVEGKAVNFVNGKENVPVYDYKKCIRCYCCQELCPQHAIHVK